MSKSAIFSYCNFQIDARIAENQKKVIEKLNKNSNIVYEFVFYNAKDGDVFPDQVIDENVFKLFYEKNYDNILILDIDCIPLSTESIEYTLKKAEEGFLIGNIQRSNHLKNNKHVYCAASCVAFSKDTFKKLGEPSSFCTKRSDICEEYTWMCEEKNIPIEFFIPSHHEGIPHGGKLWDLNDGLPQYGIGTTFTRKDNKEMFYHLFEIRVNKNIDNFLNKCGEIIDKRN